MGKIIYEPAGRAKEYCKLAANLYRGCGHGCKYCYAPEATRTDREKFYREPQPRKDVISKLSKQLEKNTFNGPVLLCFTCDPYQPINEEHGLARKALQTLKLNGLSVEILTKGGKRAESDFHLLGEGDKVGATLTFVNDADSLEWEPGAALPAERFAMLEKAKSMGIMTWASLEPVIDPEQSLEIIRWTHEYVDLFKVGTLNHHPRAREIDWRKFGRQAVELLDKLGCSYYIKNDLRRHLTKTA